MKNLLIICSTLIVAMSSLQATQPNIVFVLADDLGWGDVAFHGGITPTPHLNQLAREGLELTQHYVAPVCSPTRSGFLTGRYWSRFNITNPINTRGLPWNTVTLPKALKEIGYDTCLIGKWHLGSKPEWGPNRYGFDHAYGSLAGGISPWNHRYKKGDYTLTWHRNGELIEEEGHVTDLLTREAVGWIHERDETPFLLYVPFTAVHLPLKEPTEWLNQVSDSITDEVSRHYSASVMHLDDSIGKIVKALEQAGKRENTLFIFSSDNGGSTAENNDLKYPDDHCPNGRLPGNNLPLRGQKGTIYEGGTRVPTLVSWPGHIKSGKNNTPVHITDWMPTFCALAGYVSHTGLNWDGTDLSELLRGKPINLKDRFIYSAAPNWRASSLRQGEWKLIVTDRKPANEIELFNITKDPSESFNLASVESQRVAMMLKQLKASTTADGEAKVDESNE